MLHIIYYILLQFHLLIVQLPFFFVLSYFLCLCFLYLLLQFFLFLIRLLFCLGHFVILTLKLGLCI